ncbi:MAG: pyridoxal-phosphate dependent enzyme, partial [Sphingobacterium sp.]
MAYAEEHKMTFIPPFDDEKIIEGQGTVAVEILDELPDVEVIMIPIGGGGLASGISYHIKNTAPTVQCYGVEPAGAASMQAALEQGKPVALEHINKFVDGAAVKKVGKLNFDISSQLLDGVKSVPEGKICTTILELYNKDAIVAEPAGALSI